MMNLVSYFIAVFLIGFLILLVAVKAYNSGYAKGHSSGQQSMIDAEDAYYLSTSNSTTDADTSIPDAEELADENSDHNVIKFPGFRRLS